MVCHHLRLNLLDKVVRDTGQNQNGCTGKHDVFEIRQFSENRRNQNDDRKEQRIGPVQSACGPSNKIGSRATRANTGNIPAVLLKVVRDLDRVKLNGGVEEREPDDQ